MTYKNEMNENTECWTDLSYSGGGSLTPFYIFIGVSSLLIGLVVLVLLLDSLLVSGMSNFGGFSIVFLSSIAFLCSGIIHLLMAYNFKSRVRVIEDLGEDCFKLTFWRRGKNKNGLRFLRQEIEQVNRCPDPKNIKEFLLALPREPSCYCFRLCNGDTFHVAGDEESVQKPLDILSVAKIEPIGDRPR